MKDVFIFKRVETKYRIDSEQKKELLDALGSHLIPDAHGNSTVSSIYLDTPDLRILRNSMDSGVYKEKLRLRSYGVPSPEDRVFLEIKKKYKKVVYKRRVALSLKAAMAYLDTGQRPEDSQIMREIDYAFSFYRRPRPAFLISYEREAFELFDQPGVRLTFDHGIRYRRDELLLSSGNRGRSILGEDEFILEIKTGGGMPLFLPPILDELSIRPTSFSKFKNSYFDSVSHIDDKEYSDAKLFSVRPDRRL